MMPYAWLDDLRRELPDLAVAADRSWSRMTTLGVGSACPVVATPSGPAEFSGAVRFCRRHGVPFFILGGGSNIVGADAPVDMLVLRLRPEYFGGFACWEHGVKAGAALRTAEVARRAAAAGFGGLAPLAGIPGQLGGLARMNAGANGSEIGALVEWVSGIEPDGTIFSRPGSCIEWRYRGCSLPEDTVILEVQLRLPAADPDGENAKIDAELAARREREPQGRNAGCIFRNPGADRPAGKLIDAAGLKGSRAGGMVVSAAHGNFLVNEQQASAADFAALAERVVRTIYQREGVFLNTEVKFVDAADAARVRGNRPEVPVALFKGGSSSEREISLRSAAAIAQALANAGYTVREYDITNCALPDWLTPEMVVYPALHGGFGENGELQALLEAAGIRFVGSGSVASRLVMDKIGTKRLLDQHSIPTAPWAVVTPEHPEFPPRLKFPVVLKAPKEGSTIGIAKVSNLEDYAKALEELFRLDHEILVEEFIAGVEITVPVVNGRALPVIEIRSPNGFYDYDAKYVYNQGHTNYFCPPETVPETIQKLAQEYSLAFYRLAGCRDLLRADFIIDADGIPMMLEGNSLPGCTATSLVPKAAKVAGISFEQLCSELVESAAARK